MSDHTHLHLKPQQVVVLAAELYCFRKGPQSPYRCAVDATRLCELGREIQKLAERSADDPSYNSFDEDRWNELEEEARQILSGYLARYDRGALIAVVDFGLTQTALL